MDNKELESLIRDILDRNNFINQKIDLDSVQQMNKNVPVQDAFRIRVMSPPLQFSVDIVKPLPLKDFLFVVGRLQIAPEHLAIINKLDLEKRMDLFDEIRLELTRKESNFKFVEGPEHSISGVECMLSVFVSENKERLTQALFRGMEDVNKSFFLVIVILQRFLRKAGYSTTDSNQSSGKSFYQ